MDTLTSNTEAGDQIRQILDDWRAALSARDTDRMLAHYSPDVVFFDAVPPYQHRGADACRQSWKNLFPWLPPRIESEIREQVIKVDGDLAFMHCLSRIINTDTREAATCGWVRVTVCYQRKQGAWKVVHEHVSVPFDPQTSQAAFIREL
jgi:uncharacterized protein (TIGR02246 family)